MNFNRTWKLFFLSCCVAACIHNTSANNPSVFSSSTSLALEEDCFNGIDDDQDGFTDAEDIDCLCASAIDTNNLILNPSFEEITNDPDCIPDPGECSTTFAFDNDCVANWVNVNGIPSPANYYTRCYLEDIGQVFPPLSYFPPGDNAIMTSLSTVNPSNDNLTSSDYIGGTLSESLIAGETYEFTVELVPVLFLADMNPSDPDLIHSLNFSLYGNITGNNFPNNSSNSRCPSLLFPLDYVELVNFEVAARSELQPWITAKGQFVAPASIDNIVFGPGCEQNSIANIGFYTFTTLMNNLNLNRVLSDVDPTDIEVTISDISVPCSGETTLQATPLPDASFQWYLNNQLITGATGLNYTFENNLGNAGEYAVQLIDDMGNCGVSLPLNVVIEAPVEVSENIVGADCFGNNTGAIDLTISNNSGLNYSWTDEQGQTIGVTQNIEDLPAGNYFLEIVDAENCTTNYQYTIGEPAELTLQATTENVICQDEPGQLLANAQGGTPEYSYSLDGENFSTATNFALPAGNYSLSVIDANFCQQTITDLIIENEDQLFLAIVAADTILQLGEAAQLNLVANQSLADATIAWTPSNNLDCENCETVTADIVESTTFQVVVTEGGCATQASLRVEVKKNRDIFIPNAFSPNGDGSNDLFQLFPGNSVEEILEFNVFNRWGAVIYSGTEKGWNGEFRSQPMEPGVYTWIAEIRFRDGVQRGYSGDVQLLR